MSNDGILCMVLAFKYSSSGFGGLEVACWPLVPKWSRGSVLAFGTEWSRGSVLAFGTQVV